MNLEKLEQEPKLSFNYSLETEMDTVRWLLSMSQFFKKGGYDVSLPIGFSLDDEWDYEKFKEKIGEEIDEEKINIIEDHLKQKWTDIVARLKTVFKEIGYEIPKEYRISLTQYGPGGSYNEPNYIKLKINNPRRNLEEVVAHEAIHIAIEPLIKKYGITHWVKEHIVDLLMKKVYPESYQTQKTQLSAQEINEIDNTFNQNYPNIEKILEEISQINI